MSAKRTSEADETVIELEQRIEAAPEIVFSFLVEPERYRRWMGVAAKLDPRPGGAFLVRVNEVAVASGEYLVVDPPHRLVMTWGWEGSEDVPPGPSTVEWTLQPDGEATILRLRHTGLPNEEQRTQHAHGWTHFVGRLAVAGAGGDPGPDPMASAG
ncbi:MAG TPA: SRPBCC domain-containing protein [Actinomycetota bacterium]